MTKKLIVLTHANRATDFAHVSWAEIYVFGEYLQKWLDKYHLADQYQVKLVDVDHLDEIDPAQVQELFVFQTGTITSVKLIDLIDQVQNTSVVLCDPNWNVEINQQFDRLITPFNALAGLTGESAAKKFERIAPNIHFNGNYPDLHLYFPFGLLYLTTDYWSMMQSQQPVTQYPLQVYANRAYIGSLKTDRLFAFNAMMGYGPIDFIGSYTKSSSLSQLQALSNYKQDQVHFPGRLSAHAVGLAYQQYDALYFAPDDKMLKLDNCYERQAEFARNNGTLIPVANDRQGELLMSSLINYADRLANGTWKINIQKLNHHYRQNYNDRELLLSNGIEFC